MASVANLAYNPTGRGVPKVTASFSAEGPPVAVVNDGEAAFNYYSRKRWTAVGTSNVRDWVEIDLGDPREVRQAGVYFWAWESRGTAAPRAWGAEYWDSGTWAPVGSATQVPSLPLAMALNSMVFEPVTAPRLRIWFEHAAPAATGISEITLR
jgi:hypothetical protein